MTDSSKVSLQAILNSVPTHAWFASPSGALEFVEVDKRRLRVASLRHLDTFAT
jgi:hypothetical protein